MMSPYETNEQKRNLAFYKRGGEAWTWDEYVRVCEYTDSEFVEDHEKVDYFHRTVSNNKFMFDDGTKIYFMYPWSWQGKHKNFKNCKWVAYEDVFGKPGIGSLEDIAEFVNEDGAKYKPYTNFRCIVNEFTKHDSSKNRLELIEPEFIKGLGRIVSFGAEKYSARNWQKAGPEDVERIKGALLRHIMDYLSGDKIDMETGESHLYHAACNLMFLDYFDRMAEEQ
jgi:hypothetical protein